MLRQSSLAGRARAPRFSADVAVVAIDLMLDQWRNDLGERAFAKAWAAAWHGKTILRCQALDGFPGGLPASNNMLEVRFTRLGLICLDH